MSSQQPDVPKGQPDLPEAVAKYRALMDPDGVFQKEQRRLRRGKNWLSKNFSRAATMTTSAGIGAALYTLVSNGSDYLLARNTWHESGLVQGGDHVGLYGSIFGSGETVIPAIALSALIAFSASVNMVVYAKDSWLTRRAESAIDNWLSCPSIVPALCTYSWLRHTDIPVFSAFAGSLAITFLVTPIIARSMKTSMEGVEKLYEMTAEGLGATKAEYAWNVLRPLAQEGTNVGIMLGFLRAANEAATQMFSSLGNLNYSTDYFKPIATLATTLVSLAASPNPELVKLAYADATILTAVGITAYVFAEFGGVSALTKAVKSSSEFVMRPLTTRRNASPAPGIIAE